MSAKNKNILILGCCNSMCNEATKRHSGFAGQFSFAAMMQGKLSERKEVFTCKYIEHGDRCPFTL